MEFFNDDICERYIPIDFENINIDIKRIEDTFLEFDLINSPPQFANALRRILVAEIPTFAIEYVTMRTNSSVFLDEIISHRLGLIPMANISDDTEIHLTLKKVNREKTPMKIFSDDFICENENTKIKKGVLICILAENQEIDLSCIAVKNIGAEHIKWSPVNPVSYRMHPELYFKNNVYDEEVVKYFEEGVIKMENGVAVVKNERDSFKRDVLYSPYADYVYMGKRSGHFIFTIETEVYSPIYLLKQAICILSEKCNQLIE